DLESEGLLAEVKPHRLTVPRGDRSNAVIEPMLTDQWFVAMSRPVPGGKSLAQAALDVVAAGEIRFVPGNWTAVYNQWLQNIQDWCISRQLWWGHRIPAWYDGHGRIVVAHDEVEAYRKYKNILREDPARVGEADAVKALLVAAQLYGSSTSALPAPARAQFERAHPHLLLRQD